MAADKTPAFNAAAENEITRKISELYDLTDAGIPGLAVLKDARQTLQLADEVFGALALKAGGQPLTLPSYDEHLRVDRERNPVLDYGLMRYTQAQINGLRDFARNQLELLKDNPARADAAKYTLISNARSALQYVAVYSDRLLTRKVTDVKPANSKGLTA